MGVILHLSTLNSTNLQISSHKRCNNHPVIFTGKSPFPHPPLPPSLQPTTYVITLASSIKSSSDIAPSFIILTATGVSCRHLPSLTVCYIKKPQINIKVDTPQRKNNGNYYITSEDSSLPQTGLFLTPFQELFLIWVFPIYLLKKG